MTAWKNFLFSVFQGKAAPAVVLRKGPLRSGTARHRYYFDFGSQQEAASL